MKKYQLIVDFIKALYPSMDPVLLHCPEFLGNEKKYLAECIDTKYVSYVGRFVGLFEESIKAVTGVKHAVALVNGTSALQLAIIAGGVGRDEEVITQSLTFAATAAAICHAGAIPVFIDSDMETLGMSPDSLRGYLREHTEMRSGRCINKVSGRVIKAVVPVHVFGHPVKIAEIKAICDEYTLSLIEDAAESLGSYRQGVHTGTTGVASILSFNGNKLVTTGGGGMVLSNDKDFADRVRFLSTTAKRPHAYEFFHDEVGYNLRMPSLNAAVGLGQMEKFSKIIENKRETANRYHDFFEGIEVKTVREPHGCSSNYWLNTIVMNSREERDAFLQYTNARGVQTRPVWTLMHKLPPYEAFARTDMTTAEWLEDRLVNIPSSVRA